MLVVVSAKGYANKKLSYRIEAARCFVSLNISLSHLRPLKISRSDATENGMCRPMFLYVIHCNYVYLVPFLRHSASNNSMTLKSHHSIHRIRVLIGVP